MEVADTGSDHGSDGGGKAEDTFGEGQYEVEDGIVTENSPIDSTWDAAAMGQYEWRHDVGAEQQWQAAQNVFQEQTGEYTQPYVAPQAYTEMQMQSYTQSYGQDAEYTG